jgi:hypothetical protein
MKCKKLYGTDPVLWRLNFSMFLLESIPVLESIPGKALDYPKQTRVEVTYSGKHSSLLKYRINYSCKKLYILYSLDFV